MAVNKVVYAGETLIDTSGVTVTADNMVKGVTALNSAGEEIEGTIDKKTGSVFEDYTNIIDTSDKTLTIIQTKLGKTCVIPSDVSIYTKVPNHEFGNALSSDVMHTATFTSIGGYKINGTFTLDDEITNQVSLIEQIKTALQNKAAPNVQLINFTIDGIKHVAIEGMTWKQYCLSECNIFSYVCGIENVWENSNQKSYVVDQIFGYAIPPSSTIVGRGKYSWKIF